MADWVRHDLPPWEQAHGYTAEYGLPLDGVPGGWLIVGKRCIDSDPDDPRERSKYIRRWVVMWAFSGLHGPGMHLVTMLFATRRVKAAKMLAELWVSTKHISPLPPAVSRTGAV